MAKSRIPWIAVAVGGAATALGLYGVGKVISARKREGAQINQRVALIGDSYAVGLGPELTKIFPNFRFEGHIGTNTAQWANRIRSACDQCGDWLPAFKPDVVLVALGVNDGKTPNASNYQTIVRGLHGLGARVIWIEPPAEVWTPVVRQTIASLGVPTVPATKWALSDDGIHPQSYVPWAHEIADTIAPLWRQVPRA